ncbi:MAG: hypothetical protein CME60_09220 [Halobacteriovoraceae bacterium]|nr:hypothetical protein [Halobacteriovoraceae bacterium]
MRFQYLELENITSLKGKHRIDFDEISKQSDLFAITGPTGSGKSTLLMAMAMALYAENHKGLNAADLVTTHCPFGRIELQFSLQNSIYNVTWSCQTLKKDGSPRKSPLIQRVWKKNGDIEETNAQEVLGLDWKQFSKVVILNQGQFSDFLTANFKDRKEILEKLMGHDQLKDIGKTLRARLSALETEIKSLEGQSHFASPLSPEEFKMKKALLGECAQFLEVVEVFEKEISLIFNKTKEDIALKQKSLEINEQLTKKNHEIEETQTILNQAIKDLNEAEKKFLNFQSEFKEKRPFLKEAIVHKQNLEKLQGQEKELLAQQVENQTNLNSKNQSIESKKIEREENREEITAKIKESFKESLKEESLAENINLKEKLDHSKHSLSLMEETIEDLREYKQIKLQIENIYQQRQEIEKEGKNKRTELLRDLKKKLMTSLSDENSKDLALDLDLHFERGSFNDLKDLIEKSKESTEYKLTQNKESKTQSQKLEIELEHLNSQLTQLETKAEQLQLEKADNSKQIELEINQFEQEKEKFEITQKENKRWQLLKLSYESLVHDQRNGHKENHKENDKENHHLDNSTPCPVCHSTEIEWDEIFLPLKENIDAVKQKEDELRENIQSLEKDLQKRQYNDTHLKKNIEETSKEVKRIKESIQKKNENLIQIKKLSIDSPEEWEKYVISLSQALYELTHFMELRSSLSQKWKSWDEQYQVNIRKLDILQEKISKHRIEFESFDLEISQSHLTKALKIFLEAKNPSHEEDHKRESNSLEEVLTQWIQEKDNLVKFNDSLQRIILLKQREDSFSEIIENLEKDSLLLKKKEKNLEDQLKELSKELTAFYNKESINKYPKNPEEVLAHSEEELESLRDRKDKLNKEKIDHETTFRQATEQIKNLKDRLIELEKLHLLYADEISSSSHKLKELNFHNEFTRMKSLFEKQEASEILLEAPYVDQTKDFEYWLSLISKYISRPWKSFEEGDNAQKKKPIPYAQDEFLLDKRFHLESVAPQMELAKRFLQNFNKSYAAIEQEIKTYESQQERISQLKKELKQKKKDWDRFETLNHYIGKDRFRDFALTILENTLLEMANHEISSLAEGRYQLLHAKAGKKSEFMVIDHWHGGTQRKVSTLSGGETFLLSLGLAMGLSDITRGQTEVESFFIDEGFGTLDEESISQVLDCLMAIQSRGKQIGLISHVTSLTSQIPVRIEINKNNFGESTLSLS